MLFTTTAILAVLSVGQDHSINRWMQHENWDQPSSANSRVRHDYASFKIYRVSQINLYSVTSFWMLSLSIKTFLASSHWKICCKTGPAFSRGLESWDLSNKKLFVIGCQPELFFLCNCGNLNWTMTSWQQPIIQS